MTCNDDDNEINIVNTHTHTHRKIVKKNNFFVEVILDYPTVSSLYNDCYETIMIHWNQKFKTRQRKKICVQKGSSIHFIHQSKFYQEFFFNQE